LTKGRLEVLFAAAGMAGKETRERKTATRRRTDHHVLSSPHLLREKGRGEEAGEKNHNKKA